MAPEQSTAVAAKGFIVSGGKLLIVKRKDDNVQMPGIWELPGGRLHPGESPFDGLKREVLEEVGVEITVLNPLKVHHFVRKDGQTVTMIAFLCKAKTTEIRLGEEHSQAKWIPINEAKMILDPFYREELSLFEKYFSRDA